MLVRVLQPQSQRPQCVLRAAELAGRTTARAEKYPGRRLQAASQIGIASYRNWYGTHLAYGYDNGSDATYASYCLCTVVAEQSHTGTSTSWYHTFCSVDKDSSAYGAALTGAGAPV